MDSRPVGMLDSGVGGLSVLREFQAIAPNERVIYFADTAFFPYGSRTPAEVRKRVFTVVHRLIQSNVKLVVLACNTASAAALVDLREMFPDLPFVGMVPGLKPAVLGSRRKHVAILATSATLSGELYEHVVDEFGGGVRVENVPAPGLAALVERGEAGTTAAREAIADILGPAIRSGADTIVLGCTHYSFLRDDVQTAFPGVTVVDTAASVARRTADVLRELDLAAPPGQEGGLSLIVTLDPEAFAGRMEALGFPHAQTAERIST